jgi:hypothetical protein
MLLAGYPMIYKVIPKNERTTVCDSSLILAYKPFSRASLPDMQPINLSLQWPKFSILGPLWALLERLIKDIFNFPLDL